MYKYYNAEEFAEVLEKTSSKIRSGIETRLKELEEKRDAINDRYPFEDLFLKWAEVDYEKEILTDLLQQLEVSIINLRSKTKDEVK